MEILSHNNKKSGEVRNKIYELLHSWGVELKGEKHNQLKALLIEYTDLRAGFLTEEFEKKIDDWEKNLVEDN